MRKNIGALTKIYEKVKELNRQNNLLKDKYNSDPKYARIHKRLVEKGTISEKESKILMLCNR
jgi:type I restriction enzyme R subunit